MKKSELTKILYICFQFPLSGYSYTVAVFGGSGFVGRRITENLVNSGCDVISISRSGKPPSYFHNDATEKVSWVDYDLGTALEKSSTLELPKIDAAISCVGNVNPKPEWDKFSFWGLAWDDDILYKENGLFNKNACQIAKDAGAEKFVYISISYEVAKMVEGPIPGYTDGKRLAEHSAFNLFGENDAIILGPSLIYGGKRFPKLGNLYRHLVESPLAKAYLRGNDALRKLSFNEDWVEKSLFSPPVDVDVVARVASAAACGLVTRDMVEQRRQGFFDSNGQPVVYDDVIFVDGTKALESIDENVKESMSRLDLKKTGSAISESWVFSNVKMTAMKSEEKEPPFEGALIGKSPYLFPLPVALIISSVAYGMTSGIFLPVT